MTTGRPREETRQRPPLGDVIASSLTTPSSRVESASVCARRGWPPALTQQQLAAGRYTKAYVSALETGGSKPSMAALTFFADRLGIPASRFLDDEPATWRRLEVDLELAAGRWQPAADGYRELLEHAPNREVRAELLRGLSEALAGLDRGAEAAAAGAEAAQIFASVGRPADAAVASYWLAAGEYAQGNTVEAESIFREILTRVRGGLRVEPDFELRLIMALSSTASRDGRHGVALAYLEEVRGLADSLDDHRRGTFLFDLAHSYRETGDYEAAIRAGIASLALFRATAFELGSAALENDLALSFLALGNLARAEEFATELAEALREARRSTMARPRPRDTGADRARPVATGPAPGSWHPRRSAWPRRRTTTRRP